jgi:hypothetical protein
MGPIVEQVWAKLSRESDVFAMVIRLNPLWSHVN